MQHPTTSHAEHFAKQLLLEHQKLAESEQIKLEGLGAETLEALFLGNRGGNAKFLQDLLVKALNDHVQFRNDFFPADPDYLDADIQNSVGFKKTMLLMSTEYDKLLKQLQESGTFFSMRSVGHMLWDTTLPGVMGYFAALLYNQNNVAAEASPVTTLLEMHVGNDLCKLLGYSVSPIGKKKVPGLPADKITGWGHITCDGSVANLEGLWMARNLKFYAVSVKAALLNESSLANAKDFQVKLLSGNMAYLILLDSWTILNLPIDEVLAIPNNISSLYNLDLTLVSNAIAKYTVQNIGFHDMLTEYLPDIKKSPVSFCSATRHYSWPKGAAILGIGANNMRAIRLDLNARMDVDHLKNELDNCLANKIPVLNVVAIIGTTEESAVDPLKQILATREEYRKKGIEFAIHLDAAWGGYFRTMLNSTNESDPTCFKSIDESTIAALPMSEYTTEQYQLLHLADSITIDPHKSGYVPYPAGGLCYRNSAMRNLVSFTAPVVYHGGVDPTVGVYGVEGSKPGAAAAAVYLSHKVIRPNIDGYGKLSGECFFNAKRFYAALVCLNIEPLPFFVVPLIPIPAIQEKLSANEVKKQYEFIRDRIVNKTNQELLADADAFSLFKKLGGDQTIITYMYNYYVVDGVANQSMAKANDFNDEIYRAFSFKPYENKAQDTEIVVTSSAFDRQVIGDKLMDDLRERLRVNDGHNDPINFIISTIMNPWLSNTVKGSFIPQLMDIISRNVTKIARARPK